MLINNDNYIDIKTKNYLNDASFEICVCIKTDDEFAIGVIN